MPTNRNWAQWADAAMRGAPDRTMRRILNNIAETSSRGEGAVRQGLQRQMEISSRIAANTTSPDLRYEIGREQEREQYAQGGMGAPPTGGYALSPAAVLTPVADISPGQRARDLIAFYKRGGAQFPQGVDPLTGGLTGTPANGGNWWDKSIAAAYRGVAPPSVRLGSPWGWMARGFTVEGGDPGVEALMNQLQGR